MYRGNSFIRMSLISEVLSSVNFCGETLWLQSQVFLFFFTCLNCYNSSWLHLVCLTSFHLSYDLLNLLWFGTLLSQITHRSSFRFKVFACMLLKICFLATHAKNAWSNQMQAQMKLSQSHPHQLLESFKSLNPYSCLCPLYSMCLCDCPAPADQPCTVVAEPHSGHTQPRGVGHEGEAVSHRSGD